MNDLMHLIFWDQVGQSQSNKSSLIIMYKRVISAGYKKISHEHHAKK
jgi:hypothetical protein